MIEAETAAETFLLKKTKLYAAEDNLLLFFLMIEAETAAETFLLKNQTIRCRVYSSVSFDNKTPSLRTYKFIFAAPHKYVYFCSS